ncbi:hypothetical protein [Streptomyces sp. AK02-04a]|nr:hypothetical protein [Streptomyces sp. AK02-04a]MDX3761861.1 hypothetical protein [Streptomyces sp. AK02-04a]
MPRIRAHAGERWPFVGGDTSRGYPRAVNNLALQSLGAAFATGKKVVGD